ncbi:MAG: transglutaminase family protein [Ignavibacteria bacterium]|nr:transglutaminase family protein [Ignavibacteria bacterium]
MPETKKTTLTERPELEHLIKLLDDEDENIYSSVRDRFLSHGDHSFIYLKKYINDENILIKKRASEIISILNFETFREKFHSVSADKENGILEEAIFLLALFEYPEADIEYYKRELDKMAGDIESGLLKINSNHKKLDTLDILNTVNNYLFFEKGFKGNAENYYEPENSYLNKVMDRKLGIPVTLSIIYLLISKRLNLPVFGISLPGHFIIKYSDQEEEFFIDPFNNGSIISMNEAKEFIKKIGVSKDDFDNIPYLKNSSDKEIILRVMRNLVEIYKNQNDPVKSDQIEKLMENLS